MAANSLSELELLEALIETPSVSGTEEAIARFVEQSVQSWGLTVERSSDGVLVRIPFSEQGPVLALVSHLDTVPPGQGWTRDPFKATREGDRLYGRGSTDAKASVAAMLTAARDVAASASGLKGSLLVLLGLGEETKDTTMAQLVERAGHIDAAIIGEPTNLQAAVAQRGLIMADLLASGDQKHAAYVGNPGFQNAVGKLARDLIEIETLLADRDHSVLGKATIAATMLEAGIGRNVTPPFAKAVLDIRTTPAWSNQEVAELLRQRMQSNVTITSSRFPPCETPGESRLLACMRTICPEMQSYGSPTCSDWVFLREKDGVKFGPGTSQRSHMADEAVDIAEVTAARRIYAGIAREYLQ